MAEPVDAPPPKVPPAGTLPAPALREVADVWFDSGHDPRLAWDAEGRFTLVDGADPSRRLELWEAPRRLRDPRRVAAVLADGLAACDFPPTGTRADPSHVAAALRAAGIDPEHPA